MWISIKKPVVAKSNADFEPWHIEIVRSFGFVVYYESWDLVLKVP